MQNDIISRSALVAELECFRFALGDVVLQMVLDRVIERVKAQPAVDVNAPARYCVSGELLGGVLQGLGVASIDELLRREVALDA